MSSVTSPVPSVTPTALGALARHLVDSDAKHFQPANINYGLFEDLGMRVRKRERRGHYARRAHEELARWTEAHDLDSAQPEELLPQVPGPVDEAAAVERPCSA